MSTGTEKCRVFCNFRDVRRSSNFRWVFVFLCRFFQKKSNVTKQDVLFLSQVVRRSGTVWFWVMKWTDRITRRILCSQCLRQCWDNGTDNSQICDRIKFRCSCESMATEQGSSEATIPCLFTWINARWHCWPSRAVFRIPPDYLSLNSALNRGPLISRWEMNKFENCWYKSVRILEVLKLLFQQFLNLSSSQRDMSGPKLGDLSNNRWSGGTHPVANHIWWVHSPVD